MILDILKNKSQFVVLTLLRIIGIRRTCITVEIARLDEPVDG